MKKRKFLYKNFLKDEKTYHLNRAFWHKLFMPIFRGKDNYKSYITEKNNNENFFLDGNPIFNIMNYKTGMGLRIIQESPEEFEDYYTKFMKESMHEIEIKNKITNIKEMVIVLTLTEENYKKAKRDVIEWFTAGELNA